MLFNIVADTAKLCLFIVSAYVLLGAYARRRRPQWTEHLTKRRLAVLGILTLAVGGIKLIEDVVAKESGPVDEAILWLFRNHVPAALNGFFAVFTFSGSARFLVPIAVMAAVVLLVSRRRFEAVLLGASMLTATLVVWGMKAIVGRARPALPIVGGAVVLGFQFPQRAHPEHRSIRYRCRVVRGADLASGPDPGDGACCVVDGPGRSLPSRPRCALAVGCAGRHVLGCLHSAADQSGERPASSKSSGQRAALLTARPRTGPMCADERTKGRTLDYKERRGGGTGRPIHKQQNSGGRHLRRNRWFGQGGFAGQNKTHQQFTGLP